MRAFRVRLPSGAAYWTVVDEDFVVVRVALFTRTGFWHRSWGVVAERYPVVRLRRVGFA